jgi:hypothetical protein
MVKEDHYLYHPLDQQEWKACVALHTKMGHTYHQMYEHNHVWLNSVQRGETMA